MKNGLSFQIPVSKFEKWKGQQFHGQLQLALSFTTPLLQQHNSNLLVF